MIPDLAVSLFLFFLYLLYSLVLYLSLYLFEEWITSPPQIQEACSCSVANVLADPLTFVGARESNQAYYSDALPLYCTCWSVIRNAQVIRCASRPKCRVKWGLDQVNVCGRRSVIQKYAQV
jgi:hypothetical protein